MLAEDIADPDAESPESVRAAYESELAAVVSDVGAEQVAAETDVEAVRVQALQDGESPELTVEEAADVLACHPDYPDAEATLAEVRDHLMLSMSSAVLDVEGVESGLNGDLDAREIQQKIEGRQPMTLAEYARIHHYVASENPY